jgi:hypothetical protein
MASKLNHKVVLVPLHDLKPEHDRILSELLKPTAVRRIEGPCPHVEMVTSTSGFSGHSFWSAKSACCMSRAVIASSA